MNPRKKSVSTCIISLMILYVTGCSEDFLPEPFEKSSLDIQIVSGNYQQGDNTEFLKDSIVFIITDLNQNPVPGKPVDFHIVAGGGMLDDNQRMTDSEGMVYVKWKAGTGIDQIFKATVKDDNGIAAESWVISNSDIELTTKWISGVNFYSNFTEPLQHDNKILETNNFLIFSDAASDDNKVIFAKIAEEHLYDILTWFELEYQELCIDKRDRKTKIKIYAHTNTTTPGIWRGEENYGILIQSYASPGWVREALKHELVHMVELLTIGPENFVGSCPPVWFTEGIAESLSGNTCICPTPADAYPINSQTKLESWFGSHKNPVTIEEFSDMGSARACEYYEMFGLVINYLLDPEGGDVDCDQVKGMYKDLAVNKNFSISFEQNVSVSLTELEDSIFNWLTNYLPEK